MNITILGASGKTGTEVITQALEAGHNVSVVVRQADAVKKQPNLTITVGDVTDARVIAKASKGADVIVSTLGAMGGTLMTDAVTAVITASKTTKVKRFILMSSFAVRKDQLGTITKAITGLAMSKVITDKQGSEELLRASDLDWTIVYPTGLTTAAKGAKVRVVPATEKVDMKNKISRADVAAWIVKEADKKAHVKKNALITQA